MNSRWSIRKIARGEKGQVILEYTLLLVTFGIPMVLIARWLLGTLAGYYAMVTFLETSPLP